MRELNTEKNQKPQRQADIFRGHGVEIYLPEGEDFLKIRETLTRIGEAQDGNKLSQICYILHKKGRYAIVHIKELLHLDGLSSQVVEEDVAVRNTIAILLEDWGLLDIADPDSVEYPRAAISRVRIIPFREKKNWTLVSNYAIGRKKEETS